MMKTNRSLDMFILLILIMMLIGIIKLMGNEDIIYPIDEPNNCFVWLDPNETTATAEILLEMGDFMPDTVSFHIGNSAYAEFHVEGNVVVCNVTKDEFLKCLPRCLYSCVVYEEPNEPITIQWAEPNEPNKIVISSQEWTCTHCDEQFDSLMDLTVHSCLTYTIIDPLADIKSRLDSIEQRLKALEEKVDANDENIESVARSMTKYIDIVHFEGNKQ